ncbi:DM13 domain-containing protein [Ornithinimicrobium sp. INDO-MA30-4]|uniref:DM13 domain-containing protein n=1 Tax=Ornithinimicrobium sp. INDO-MA30-4 TaxID=2908651 RepID=UPI001F23DE7E|nr:DM13 domain-containing protein [Ornithinimicrobium sp. INDO-MA30-4]UJH70661.1 DM13 domain-containing protein [Ornithinimicrobium sp. INDO-MA30-4]
MLNLESDFQTGDGPDLEVYVTSQNIADIGSRDRAESPPQRVRIGIMPRARGEQSYLLPTENFGQYNSILIYCRAHMAPFCIKC